MSEFLDWRSCTDEKEKYQAYLCSNEWWTRRQKVMHRARGRCEKCKVNHADSVHHLTYIRKYNESLSDLIAVCNDCHDGIHARKKFADPKQVRPQNAVNAFSFDGLKPSEIRSGLDDETVKVCLLISAKRAAIECMETIKRNHPEIVTDDWLVKYAEQRAFEMDCEKYGVKNG